MDFTGITPTNADTTLFLNGQLLVGGSTSDVTANTVDYAFNNDTQVRFVCPIDVGDAITIFHTTTSFSTGKDFALHTDDTAFNNARVITAGDGISISKATPRQLIISNTGLIQRSKTHITSVTTYGTNDAFTATGVDFSSKSYSDDRIDIFMNGTLLIKGTDYQLNDQDATLSSSQFKLIGSTSISSGDILTAILF
jgi:archaellum component FlaF (FlaF/FlaG flagellin family)